MAELATGGKEISIEGILREAWALTDGFKGPCWAGFAVVLLLIGLVNAVVGVAFGSGGMLLDLVSQLVVTAVVYPFLTGTVMMGVRRSVGLSVAPEMVFGYMNVVVPVVVASLLMSIIISIGFLLLIVPGVYLSIGYSLVIPLIADRGLDAWPAMETSRQAVGRQWFRVAGVLVATGVIVAVSALPLGIGLIWTMPMSIVVVGILYRDLFGVQDTRA